MAERRAARHRPDPDELADPPRERGDTRGSGDDRSRPSRRAGADLRAADVAQEGLRQIAELTGKQPEGVTGVEPGEDGWVVGVEIVEDRRIPSSTDILAIYEVEFDPAGELVSYRRIRRYPRGHGDGEVS